MRGTSENMVYNRHSLMWLHFWNLNGISLKVAFSSLTRAVTVAQLYPTLCDPMDYTIHGILQARILELGSQPKDQT